MLKRLWSNHRNAWLLTLGLLVISVVVSPWLLLAAVVPVGWVLVKKKPAQEDQPLTLTEKSETESELPEDWEELVKQLFEFITPEKDFYEINYEDEPEEFFRLYCDENNNLIKSNDSETWLISDGRKIVWYFQDKNEVIKLEEFESNPKGLEAALEKHMWLQGKYNSQEYFNLIRRSTPTAGFINTKNGLVFVPIEKDTVAYQQQSRLFSLVSIDRKI